MPEILAELMRAAIPLHIIKLHEEGCSLDNFERFKTELTGYHDEALNNPQFTEALVGKIEGQSAVSFNRTARVCAILSFLPGGISIFGSDFCAGDFPSGGKLRKT